MFQRIVWGGDVVFLLVTEGFVWIRSCSERRGGQFVGGRIGGLLVELGGVGFVCWWQCRCAACRLGSG